MYKKFGYLVAGARALGYSHSLLHTHTGASTHRTDAAAIAAAAAVAQKQKAELFYDDHVIDEIIKSNRYRFILNYKINKKYGELKFIE